MFLVTVCLFILSATCLAFPFSDDEHFRKYITDIQSQTDNTVKPCENFQKYACGNIKHHKEYNMLEKMSQLLEHIINNEKSHTEAETLVRTFLNSCKNKADLPNIFEEIDELKSVKTWPVTRDYTDKEISKLFGYLITLDITGFFSIKMRELYQDNIISINIDAKTWPHKLASTLDKFGVSAEESTKTIEQIKNFIIHLENIATVEEIKSNYDTLENVEALKEAIPNFDWDTYFTTFTKVYNLNYDDFLKKSVKIANLEKLKKIVDILKATDSRTVVNYIIFRYISDTPDIICENVIKSFYSILSLNFLNAESTNENNLKMFFLRELEVYNHFGKSVSELKSQLNNPEIADDMMEYVKPHQQILGDTENMISGKFFVNLFNKFEMNEKHFYFNLINIIRTIYNNIFINRIDANLEYVLQILTSTIEKYIKMDNEVKPLLYNFITVNTDFWMKTMLMDDIYVNRTISDDCRPYKNNTDIDDDLNNDYLNIHAAYHISLNDYLKYVTEHEDELKQETEILTAANLDHTKAYMLALTQETCLDTSTRNNKNNETLLWFYKHSKIFSETWSCGAEDEMNQICDDSTFILDFKKSL